MFCIKVHRAQGEVLLAACDRELMGQTICDEERGVEICVDEKFYSGDVCGKEELLAAVTDASIVNLLGEGCVKVCLDAGLLDPECVIKFNGVSHAQILKI